MLQIKHLEENGEPVDKLQEVCPLCKQWHSTAQIVPVGEKILTELRRLDESMRAPAEPLTLIDYWLVNLAIIPLILIPWVPFGYTHVLSGFAIACIIVGGKKVLATEKKRVDDAVALTKSLRKQRVMLLEPYGISSMDSAEYYDDVVRFGRSTGTTHILTA